MNQPEPPLTRRERIAYFFSMDGTYKWIFLVPSGAVIVATFLLAFPASMAMRVERCTEKPDPALGTTQFVSYRRTCLSGGGYVNPKTEQFINFAAAVTFGLAGVLILIALVGVIARRIFGDPRYGPDLRQGFRPED